MDQLSWMFSLIPDAVITVLVHLTLIAGVVLTILGTFAEKFPFVGTYGKLAKLVGIPLLLIGIFLEGGLATEMRWRAQVAELEIKIKESEAKSTVVNETIRTVIKEKVKVVKEVQVVIQERIVKEKEKIDAECKVAPEAITILNDAARNIKGESK
jgi:hypothetical protein